MCDFFSIVYRPASNKPTSVSYLIGLLDCAGVVKLYRQKVTFSFRCRILLWDANTNLDLSLIFRFKYSTVFYPSSTCLIIGKKEALAYLWEISKSSTLLSNRELYHQLSCLEQITESIKSKSYENNDANSNFSWSLLVVWFYWFKR